MPPKMMNFVDHVYIDGKEIFGISDIKLEPDDAWNIIRMSLLYITEPNNWLKMHGMPMRRKKTWQRKRSRKNNE